MSRVIATIPQARIFPGSPGEIRSARDFVGQVASGCPVADDVVLLSSELTTNAILHTASGADDGAFFVLIHVEDARVRVEVHDLGSATAPTVLLPGAPGESGAGLGLVDAVASRWGFYGGQPGRVVWFELDWQ